MISIIGYSAMGGALGAGGLGDIAIRYGYQAYKIPYLVVTSIILIIFVQIIQTIGNHLYKKIILKRPKRSFFYDMMKKKEGEYEV